MAIIQVGGDMSFRIVAVMSSLLLLLPVSAECQHSPADSTLTGLSGGGPETLYLSPPWHPLHRMSATTPSSPALAVRISADSTTGIPVILGGLLGGMVLGGLTEIAGVYDDGRETPWRAALIYGAGVGGGAAFGAILGGREPRLLPTVAAAMVASVPLALVFIDQQGFEPSEYDVLPVLIAIVPPIIGAWFTNKMLQ
jgi:hypothetical protein